MKKAEKSICITIKKLLENAKIGEEADVVGWVKTKRISKQVFFITLSDGSSLIPLQIVASSHTFSEDLIKRITVGASLAIRGKIVTSPGEKQDKELEAHTITILGDSPASYPLQPKWHTLVFLRSIQHLRMRTTTFQAIFRIRHGLCHAIHNFFHQRDFCWLHTPIITSEDAEGAGQVFSVLSTHNNKLSEEVFFGKKVSLTVSGQLAGEAGALGLGKIYTFGPTFRAENSNTKRHLAEFWMVEPEMAFYTLQENIALAEACIKYAIDFIVKNYPTEMSFLEERAQKAQQVENKIATPLRTQLQNLIEKPFTQISYTEAIHLMQTTQSAIAPTWGEDLQTIHERYLTEHFQGGVIVTDYPKEIKAFYMRQNDDGKTVAAMDILLPGIGEVIGGSQREERLPYLKKAMAKTGLAGKIDWYLETRLFGTVPHSGFGLGLERLILFVTGMENIRDVIPFPRTPGSAVG